MQAFHSDSTAQQTRTMQTDEQKHCPQFKLPPELRNGIYSYATSQNEVDKKPRGSELPLDSGDQLTYHDDPSENYKDHHSLPVVNLSQISDVKPSNALLDTCQRIYEEARAMFAVSQRTFWKSHAFRFDLDNDWIDGASAAKEIVARLYAGQIGSMPKFSVICTTRGCRHTSHLLEDDLEMTDEELNEGYPTDCGFYYSDCSHTGNLSLAELRLRSNDLGMNLMSSITRGPFLEAHDMKRHSARTRSQIVAYEKTANTYLSFATRDRELSRIEDHAILRWKEERTRFLRKLESQHVNMKRLMLAGVLQHFRDLLDSM
ncbi:hypothetical protein MBLNU13_g01747t1 [Cladosporium sp. NU13]